MSELTYRRIAQKSNLFFFLCGLVMSISEIWKQIYLTIYVNNGIYDWWYFPFQLCSIAMYILLLLPWTKSKRIRSALLSFLMNYSLLGGIAVFADTSGLKYPAIALTVHSYTWHILLIIIGIAAGITYLKENTSRAHYLGAFKDCTLLYLGCCVIAIVINLSFDKFGNINMFYINPSYEMQQLGFASLTPYLGNLPVIIIYILATMLGANIFFHIWKLISRSYQHHLHKKADL